MLRVEQDLVWVCQVKACTFLTLWEYMEQFIASLLTSLLCDCVSSWEFQNCLHMSAYEQYSQSCPCWGDLNFRGFFAFKMIENGQGRTCNWQNFGYRRVWCRSTFNDFVSCQHSFSTASWRCLQAVSYGLYSLALEKVSCTLNMPVPPWNC